MTTEIRTSALDPFLTTRAQFDLALVAPEPQLLIDGDNMIVSNALDRLDDPAVLITGNNNVLINEAGATLTGTGNVANPFSPPAFSEGAVEITGTGNTVENQAGATITGAAGIVSSAANTAILNDGDILGVEPTDPAFDDSAGILLDTDSSVFNTGTIRANASDDAVAIRTGARTTVQNDGLVQASGEFVRGMELGEDSSIVNNGVVEISPTIFGGALSAGSGSTIDNFGTVRGTHDGPSGNVFGVSGASSTIWNGGSVEVAATAGGFAFGAVVGGGSFENAGTISAVDSGPSTFSQSVGVFLSSAASGSNSGTISASSDAAQAVGLAATDGATFSNSGSISATSTEAVAVNLNFQSEISNSGTIAAEGASARGALLGIDSAIFNDGLISAVSGVVGQPSVGVDFDTTVESQKTLVNSGTIIANIAIRDSVGLPFATGDVLTVENSGLIDGAVDLGNGVDLVTNTGTIIGDVDLGADNDVFDGRGGQVDGAVLGGDGDDVIRGGDGNDILVGGAGSDVIAGGAGADLMIGGDPGGPISFDIDALDYSDSPEGVQVNLGDATQSTSAPVKGEAGTGFGGHAEGDTFEGFRKVIGSEFDDFVYGADGGSAVELGAGNDTFDNDATLLTNDLVDLGAGNDVARTGAGDDFVDGGTGNDLLQGEDGFDFLLGGDGNDLLFGGNDGDLLDGGADGDGLFGQDGSDALFGREGDDLLVGGEGDDQLDGGAGNDLLLGGAGDDFFSFGLDGGQDQIVGFVAGAGTEDVVDLSAFDTIVSFDDVLAIASETGSGAFVSTVLTFDAATTLTFQGVQLAELNEADFLIV